MPDTNWGAVNAPATVLWSAPGKLRDYDELILRENNDPAGWSAGMDPALRLWLVGKADTMALYGEPVVILERHGAWLKVAAVEQKTRLNGQGYPGWAPAAHIVNSPAYLDALKNLPRIVVVKKTAPIYLDEALTQAAGEAPYQTRLPLLRENSGFVEVRLPNGGNGYLAGEDVKAESALTFSRSGIVSEARKFLGLPYLWAGTASYGFDCSGFTMRLYQSQGITIPRDADEQALAGTAVARQDLLPGALLFFAAKGGVGQIHHVGMYIGDGMMIHSPNSTSTVRVEAMDSGPYGDEYWGARRYSP
ncbi:Gamma-D-glutamyl-L-lysine endopeptidase [Pelotomaculum schinkii]|uniref:Gamma-D-glutamyl-L-lysine endopeptidase n=1 Tax=Pelotomaculum schinkii TaxID=78350 RepID=A0A4Y7R6N3_9FIRM|nr:C40 family peptidase [Pelotomaculum schinkii]TEB04507.1 Gamma-D-glutamyl-L-lysine endopeptidase [Pelotomaculum schinkii]